MMNVNKCITCGDLTHTPVHITQINDDGSVEMLHMCNRCGDEYINQLNQSGPATLEATMPDTIDLNHISSPQELIDFITNLGIKQDAKPIKEPCSCGLTEEEFDKSGRFGCQHCYTHFSEKMEELVFPFHQAKFHEGKKPKRHYVESLMQDPIEKEKILKLRYAKALELENYEQAKIIKDQLNELMAAKSNQ